MLTRAVQRPACCDAPGRRKLAYARANAAFCGANQHNHGLLVCWALQGEGMAVRPGTFGSGCAALRAMWLCCSLVFSFALLCLPGIM
ncbi:hypothetical protein [Escherichia coli]|uniref:hypothetical protein n=1 Tax=Escherichia coli TaxID=562 RepID=UPI0020765D24|nr:hypothetical protein [Escherichia coli]